MSTAGSRDEHPPKLLYPDDYVFAAIGQPGGDFAVYRSRHYDVDANEIVLRLRHIADCIENGRA